MYVIFPVFSSIFAPFGAPSPNLKVVPSGFVVSFPLSSLKLGAVIVVGVPTCASASVYSGCTFSAVFSSWTSLIESGTLSTCPFLINISSPFSFYI